MMGHRFFFLCLPIAGCLAYSIATTNSRRSFLASLVAASGSTWLHPSHSMAAAESTQEEEDVYFGVGCFWHIQHEFVAAERALLGRTDATLTSRTGYAGGTAADSFSRVCYHNFQGVADYGKLGHAEVVGMRLPRDKILDFARTYYSLFDPRTRDRVDPQDRGAEYRSLLGLPGGTRHASYAAMEQAATEAGFTLVPGRGNDPDTLKQQVIYVYDTRQFPFYQAEIYHQFHNDFQSPAYGAAYNRLADLALADGRLHTTGCPDKV